MQKYVIELWNKHVEYFKKKGKESYCETQLESQERLLFVSEFLHKNEMTFSYLPEGQLVMENCTVRLWRIS